MSETTTEEEKEKPWRKKGQCVTPRTRQAIVMCIEATKYAPLSNGIMRGIAIKCGVAYSSLRQVWCRFNKGLIDLGAPETPEEREISVKQELLRTMENITRYEQLLNDIAQGALSKVQEAAGEGDFTAYHELKVDRIFNSILTLARLRQVKEQGYLALMERAADEQARHRREQEKQANVVPMDPVRLEKAVASQTIENLFAQAKEAEVVTAP